jgi:serine/threonine-protein kinase
MMNVLLFNRYEIFKSLGSGGFGETFLARDLHIPSQRLVVVKRLNPVHQGQNANTELITKLFKKEATVLEELGENHPQIPKLYSYYSENGEFYLIQEYIKGKTLGEIAPINSEQGKMILSSLLQTLKYIHSKGIIHRDIKPENIIIRDGDHLPVLIDFGAVKETMGTVMLGSGSITSSVIIGTRGFMAPEQSAGRSVFSTDLYALGMTMIYAFTRKLPTEFPINRLTGEIEWQEYVPNLKTNFINILEKSIKIDLNQRYLTAEYMYNELNSEQVQINTKIQLIRQSGNNKTSESQKATKILTKSLEFMNVTSNQELDEKLTILSIIIAILTVLGIGSIFVLIQHINYQSRLNIIDTEKEKEKKQVESLRTKEQSINALNNEISVKNTSTNFPNLIGKSVIFIHYKNHQKLAYQLQDYLVEKGANLGDIAEQIDHIKRDDIRYSRPSSKEMAVTVKNEVEKFYRERGISRNLEMIDLSTRGFNTSENNLEIWIND